MNHLIGKALWGVLLACTLSCVVITVSDREDDSQTGNGISVEPDYRNFYGIRTGNNDDNLAYAKQMGYDYISYRPGMEDHAGSDSLKFYLESPQHGCYERVVDRLHPFTASEKEELSRFVALKDASQPFPDNLARSWFFSPARFSAEPDLQQQRVIDFLVDSILKKVSALERREKGFEFGGYIWDVPQLPGDFWDTVQVYGGVQVTLAYWTGYDGGDRHPAVTHEYQTYSDGHAAFYKTLWKKTRERFPHARFIVDPWHPYNDWLKHIENRPDARELVPDLIVQEKGGTDFATDSNVLKSGLVDFSKLGSASPRVFTEADNRKVAGVAASKGCAFGWDALFTEAQDLPVYTSVREVPARLKLVRMIPNWENMRRIPLDKRHWDGEVYSSPQSYISKDVIYSVQPRTNKLFAVFLTASASVEIPDSYASASVYPTDELFVETGLTTAAVQIRGNRMSLLDASQAGRGFILKSEIRGAKNN